MSGKGFLTSFEGLVEDAVAEGAWFDLSTQDVTSVSLNDNDLNKLLTFILRKLKIGQDKVKIYDDTILFCQEFEEKILEGVSEGELLDRRKLSARATETRAWPLPI